MTKKSDAKRVAICIRMTEADRLKIGQAAEERRVSVNAYVLGAAIDRVRADQSERRLSVPLDGERVCTGEPDALMAISALSESGIPQRQTEMRVRRVLAANPEADLPEIMRQAFARGAV